MILISSIVFGQTNYNPLDITNDDYYYEIKQGESLRALSELAIVNKNNNKVVTDKIGSHEISNACFLIFCSGTPNKTFRVRKGIILILL